MKRLLVTAGRNLGFGSNEQIVADVSRMRSELRRFDLDKIRVGCDFNIRGEYFIDLLETGKGESEINRRARKVADKISRLEEFRVKIDENGDKLMHYGYLPWDN